MTDGRTHAQTDPNYRKALLLKTQLYLVALSVYEHNCPLRFTRGIIPKNIINGYQSQKMPIVQISFHLKNITSSD